MRRARKTPLPGNASLSEWRFPLSECHCPGRPGLVNARASVYIVKAGDSIWRIAQRLGIARRSLMLANAISATDVLRIGQRLVIR